MPENDQVQLVKSNKNDKRILSQAHEYFQPNQSWSEDIRAVGITSFYPTFIHLDRNNP